MHCVLSGLEKAFLPFPDTRVLKQGRVEQVALSLTKKVQLCAAQAFSAFVYLLLLPPVALYSTIEYLILPIPQEPPPPAPIDLIEELAEAYPEVHGFAQSLFQDEGIGSYASPTELEGECNWNRWLNADHIEGGTTDYRRFFVRILSNPKPFVELLKTMGVNAHRFSLEWSVLEPRKGEIDLEAVELYKNFLRELKEAGIEPWGTLHHFVQPEWAEEAGGFLSDEIRDHFVDHSLKMMELFSEITHQWLKFLPLEGNLLERLICYVMSKITHTSILNFFRTGRFAYEVPGQANIRFEIPESEFLGHHRCLDFIAPQFYGFPRIKAGWNGGHAYPGYQVKNWTFWKFGFSFGSSCHPGGQMQAFGPMLDPASLRACLAEASELAPIAITETGADAMIQEHGASGDDNFTLNEEAQKTYFSAIAPILKEYKDKIIALFIWTLLRGQLEWDQGDRPALGLLPIQVDSDRNIVGHQLTPSAALIQQIYQEKMRQLAA